MAQRISDLYPDSDSVPQTYLKHEDGHIRLNLSREQFEELEERGVHMESFQAGVLVDIKRPAEPSD